MAGAAVTTEPIPSAPRVRRRLIINADDLGLSECVNRGIIESVERGVVTSASMMVNLPGWSDALDRLHSTHADIGVGLHFNIVAGRPLTFAPTITDRNTGRFHPLALLAIRALAGQVSHDEVAAECAAQLGTLQATGMRVTHVDSHRHAHALPGICPAVLDVAAAHGIQLVRAPLEAVGAKVGQVQGTLKKIVLGASWRVASMSHTSPTQPVKSAHPEHVDHFFGISLQGGTHFAERLYDTIDHLPGGVSEIMVHPGYNDAALGSLDSYTWQRERELQVLTSTALRTRLEQRNIELVNFGALHA